MKVFSREKAGLRRDAVRSQVIDVLEAQIKGDRLHTVALSSTLPSFAELGPSGSTAEVGDSLDRCQSDA